VGENMQLVQKIRVFTTPEQEDVLWHLSDRCRLLYNFALLERKREWKLRREITSYSEQQNDLPAMKKRYHEHSWVYSKVLQMVLRTLDADYRSFFSLWSKGHRDARLPRFKGRRYFITMNYNQSGFKIEQGKITLKHFYNNVPLAFRIPEEYEFERVRQVSVYRDGGDGRFYLSIVYETSERPYMDNGLYQAVDLGINKIVTAVNMQGKFFEAINPRPDKYWNPKVDAIRSRRDHCKKGSRKWRHTHNVLRRCLKKCSDQIRDYQHKLSRKMVDNTKANTIVMGQLAVKEMAQSGRGTPGLNRSTHNNGYISRFARFLTYKAKLAGKRIMEIDERNTSRR
jgi:putative transposase